MDDVVAKISSHVERICFKKVAPSESLVESGLLDSIAFVDLLVALQDSFGITLDIMTVEKHEFETVEKIAALLGTRL